MTQNLPPYRASVRARIWGLCSWISGKYRHSAAPWGWAARPGSFFSSHTCHILSAKGEIKGRLSPKKRGRNVLIYPALQLFIKARSAAAHGAPISLLPFSPRFTFCLLHTAPRSRSRSDLARTNVPAARSLSARLARGICHAEIPFGGIFGDLEKLCVSH